MEYIELLDVYAFDVEAVNKVVKEMCEEVGLEKLEPEPDGAECR